MVGMPRVVHKVDEQNEYVDAVMSVRFELSSLFDFIFSPLFTSFPFRRYQDQLIRLLCWFPLPKIKVDGTPESK